MVFLMSRQPYSGGGEPFHFAFQNGGLLKLLLLGKPEEVSVGRSCIASMGIGVGRVVFRGPSTSTQSIQIAGFYPRPRA